MHGFKGTSSFQKTLWGAESKTIKKKKKNNKKKKTQKAGIYISLLQPTPERCQTAPAASLSARSCCRWQPCAPEKQQTSTHKQCKGVVVPAHSAVTCTLTDIHVNKRSSKEMANKSRSYDGVDSLKAHCWKLYSRVKFRFMTWIYNLASTPVSYPSKDSTDWCRRSRTWCGHLYPNVQIIT